jgi:hypothetical protein
MFLGFKIDCRSLVQQKGKISSEIALQSFRRGLIQLQGQGIVFISQAQLCDHHRTLRIPIVETPINDESGESCECNVQVQFFGANGAGMQRLRLAFARIKLANKKHSNR